MSHVSIIIPCYNTGHYLADAIESCLRQTHQDIEIIVVNDGSTDNTQEVAERYPVRHIYRENGGLAAARNTGIEHAKGEFLQFLDADDILLPEKISRCLAVFEQYPDTDIVYTDFELRAEDMQSALPNLDTRPKPEGAGKRDVLRKLINETATFWVPHCVLVKTEVIRAVGCFEEGCLGVEDWNCWIKLAASDANFQYLNEKLVWYRHTAGSLSKREILVADSRLKACQLLRKIDLPEDIDLEEKIAGRHHAYAMVLWKHEQRRTAREQFRQAVTTHPAHHLSRYTLLYMSYFLTSKQAESILGVMGHA